MLKMIRAALVPAFMVLMVLVWPAPAQAAQDTWLPQFNKDQHVYIDPALRNHSFEPVRFDGLEQKLIEAGRQNNIQVYVVATQEGDETPPNGVKWGVFKLDEMLGKWQVRPDFPTQDYLVIMWVRFKDNPSKGSVAVNAGSRLKAYGMTGAHFDDANGPVTPAVKAYMRADPERAILTIVSNINQEVSAAIQAEKDRIAAEEFKKALPGIIAKVVIGLILLILAIWLTVRYFRERKKARAAIASWRERVDNANAMYIKLNDGYMGFLKDQGDWSSKFKGVTLQRYRAAVTDFAEFTVRQKAANSRIDEAQKFAGRGIFPFVGGFRKAQALLSSEDVVITGKELSLEESSLFGGVVAKTTYSPENLLEAMAELFDRTNKALASIVAAFRGADQNKKDIDGLLPEVDNARQALEGAGLTFDPYNGRFAGIKQGVEAFLAILTSDPLAAFEGSEKVEAEVRQLKADLERAVVIKAELAQTEKQTFAEVEATRPKLEAATLVFDPYARRLHAIKEALDAFRGVLLADPLTAFRTYRGADKYAQDVRAVKSDMERAITIRGQITTVEGEIGKSEKRAHEIRCRSLGYQYPLADGESTPDGADEALFTLVERDGNPDPDIAQAKKHLAEALTAVMAAELDRSEREKNAASQAAGRAYQLVEAVLAAKAFVERQVPEVRANLGRLTSEVPGADTAVAELESDFLPANFSGQPAKRDRAKKAIATAPDYFAQIKKAYDEQRFLAARSTVEGLASLVQGSRNELTEIHARLAELKKLRQQSRDVVAETRRKANALASKLRAHSFTTSQATDDEFQRFEATLRQHEAEVGKKVTDWPAAAQAASRLAGALTSIDSAIDRQKSEHESATGKVSALGSAVSDAQGYVNDGDTRQPARNKLAEAKSALADVQAQMQRAKSDWTAIGRRADEAVPLASRARELAQQDKSAANAARSAISRAESNISSVNRSYGHGVFADTSSAQSYLASARSSLSRGDYEDASRQADSAYRAAESAESDAMARVAAIIAAIEAERRRREEEERQRREAEEAARRASESSYSSSSSWSSSGSSDSYSGGGSYDSGSSGGGSYSSGSGGSDY